jgi:RNA-directed DNA polymerase
MVCPRVAIQRSTLSSVLDIVHPIAPWVGALVLHHISIDVLRASFFDLKRSAPGVDEMTWADYMGNIEANLANLHRRVHTGAYPALPSRRTYIPKTDGRQRPLGIAGWKTRSSSRQWLQS